MGEFRIEQLIKRVSATPSRDILGPVPSMRLCCKVLPSSRLNLAVFEESLGMTLPPELSELWSHVSSLRLFEDVIYGQWGLIIWTPDEAIARHQQKVAERQRDFLAGDLIIGEFLGDSELLVVRCDAEEPDFGTLLIALPLDPREDWYVVGTSLIAFLEKFLNASGEKFWED